MDGSQNPQTSVPGYTASTAAAAEPASHAAMRAGLIDSEAIDDAYPRILRYARTLARDPTEAEDLAQEVFLRAFRARETLHDPQARLSWLYRITTHAWVDRVRQRARRPEESEDAVEESQLADAGPGLQQVLEQSDMSACVQDYLVELPDGYRAVLLLHDLHELPGPQIAEMLDLSLATVKIRLHRARLKLRAALAAGCLFSHDERNVLVCERRE